MWFADSAPSDLLVSTDISAAQLFISVLVLSEIEFESYCRDN